MHFKYQMMMIYVAYGGEECLLKIYNIKLDKIVRTI